MPDRDFDRIARRAYVAYSESLRGQLYRPWDRLTPAERLAWREAAIQIAMMTC